MTDLMQYELTKQARRVASVSAHVRKLQEVERPSEGHAFLLAGALEHLREAEALLLTTVY